MRARGRGAGAGVIWDETGLVLTNHHVVAGRRRGAKASVVLRDGRELDAEVVRRGGKITLVEVDLHAPGRAA